MDSLDDILDVDFKSGGYDREEVDLVGTSKFILLFFLSFGLYGIWWMYKSWKFFQYKDRMDIIPAARAIFAIFFLYSLFEKIQQYAHANGYAKTYNSGLLFGGFFILNLLARLPDPLWLVSLLSFVCLLPAVEALNFAISNSDQYEGIDQKGFNSRQVVILVLGGLFWLLVFVGLMIPGE